MSYDLTILTATIGRKSLERLIDSIDSQTWNGNYLHLLLWDEFRIDDECIPEYYNNKNRRSIVRFSGGLRFGASPASAVYSMGIMAASTPWVTMADDDVWWEKNHLEKLFLALNTEGNWASTLRMIWTPDGLKKIGVDRFESVGDDIERNVPYEMCDSNTMIFKRELGVYASPPFRETLEYNGDRILYNYFKLYGGERKRTGLTTINQCCPVHLEEFFRLNCTN